MKHELSFLFLVLTIIGTIIVYVQYEVLGSVFRGSISLKITKLNMTEDIFCHYINGGDSLPAAEDVQFDENSIFFLETSCKGGLNSRQACSIESAARAHPNRSVHVLFSGPISEEVLERSYFKILHILNVTFFRVHLPNYAKGTGMEHILMEKILNPDAASWRVEHAADILRFITLYRHGGVYLDTDVIIVKNLDDLGRNFAGRESQYLINNAVMAFDKDGIGHEILKAIIKDIENNYHSQYWSYNGPGALTRTLEKICDNGTKINDFSGDTCKGFSVLDPDVFFPIQYPAFEEYFRPGDISKYKKTYGFHFWNRMSHDTAIVKGSLLYNMAEEYCPHILKYSGDYFGI